MREERGVVFAALRGGWWLLLAGAVVGGLVGWVLAARQEPVYAARATLAVAPARSGLDTEDTLRALEALERRTLVATFAELASRRRTREQAGAALRMAPQELRSYRLHGAVVPNTNLVRLEASGPRAETAARLASAAAEVTRREAVALYPVFMLEVVEPAEPPSRPVSPRPLRDAAIALLLGAFAGLALALVRATLATA